MSNYFEYIAIYISILVSLKNNVAPTKETLIVSDNSKKSDRRFNSDRTSLVESLSEDDSDKVSNQISLKGQSPLVNLREIENRNNSVYSSKKNGDLINITTVSKNPFDDDDEENSLFNNNYKIGAHN